jgi:hypothetical protein
MYDNDAWKELYFPIGSFQAAKGIEFLPHIFSEHEIVLWQSSFESFFLDFLEFLRGGAGA